jgi:hypothetical protein
MQTPYIEKEHPAATGPWAISLATLGTVRKGPAPASTVIEIC